MPSTSSSTAVLLFTRTPEEEVRNKSFVYDDSIGANKEVARKLIKRTRKAISESGLPLFVIYSTQQRGETFGERLTAAFQDVFDRGYDRVISIGNDTLTLSASDLLLASSLLNEHSAVVGPTPDGGAYLIGLTKSVFLPTSFSQLPWETEHLLNHLHTLLNEYSAQVAILHFQQDVNSPADLSSLYKLLLRHTALYQLIRYLHSKKYTECRSTYAFFCLRIVISTISLRAPPFTHLFSSF